MKEPNLKNIIWLSPDNLGGENISSIQYRYLNFLHGWNNNEDNACLIYAGSESQIEKAIELKQKYNLPIVMNFWGWMPERFVDAGWSSHYAHKVELIDKYVEVITVPSELVYQQLLLLGIAKITYIVPAGVDTISYLALKENFSRLNASNQYVFSVGRLVEHKNFSLVVDALKGTGLPYIIIGTGIEESNLIEKAKKTGVNLRIEKDISDDRKICTMQHAMCTVVSSTYEGLCLPIIESATIGTPVLAFEIHSHRILFGDLVEYFSNANELKYKISKLKEDLGYRKDLITKQSNIALKYSAIGCVTRLNQILMESISRLWKDRMHSECLAGKNTLAEAYNFDAKMDREYFKYRLDPEIDLFDFRAKELLKNLIPGKVLDIGSSTGIFAVKMSKAGFNVDCIDISQEYLSIAEELAQKENCSGITFKIADVENLPFENSSYDDVWAGEVIEHFSDHKKMLSEMLRVLKQNGRLLFTIPRGQACYDPFHLQRFDTEENVRKIFDGFDVTILEIKAIGTTGNYNNWFGCVAKK